MSIILAMASTMGTPVRVDANMNSASHGKCAKVCIELNLSKPAVDKVSLQGTWYPIEYEGLHIICVSRGCYGHVTHNCPSSKMGIRLREWRAYIGNHVDVTKP
ncbi:hypothetical protein RJT34_00974 [Clitoria ternatea]|uniref:Uncharacterized protein n=1 Tax=Clitoria ternatea TaxID=43366 RepID=A0AAN9Q322_CLITE